MIACPQEEVQIMYPQAVAEIVTDLERAAQRMIFDLNDAQLDSYRLQAMAYTNLALIHPLTMDCSFSNPQVMVQKSLD